MPILMKKRLLPQMLTLALVLMAMAAGCAHDGIKLGSARVVAAPSSQREAAAFFAEIGGDDGCFQIAHYLYRWQLDENDFKPRDLPLQRQLWLRRLQVVTDNNDKSQFLELVLPAIGVAVILKKPDYQIAELDLAVKSNGYRVIRVSRDTYSAEAARDYVRLNLDPDALYQRLFQARLQAQFANDRLMARMKEIIARQIEFLTPPSAFPRANTVHFAPMQAVANETWAYWEEKKLLFRFTSDLDLDKAGDSNGMLGVLIYDALQQTIVSHEEKPGDNRFLTRDQVGRALYNCIVLGKKLQIPETN